jgi:hypothetical protein
MGVDCLMSHSSPLMSTGDFESLCIIEIGGRFCFACQWITRQLANSPTPQLLRFSTRQLISPHQPAADVMMQIGSRHDVIGCPCVTLDRSSRAWTRKGWKRVIAEKLSRRWRPADHSELSRSCTFATLATSLALLRPPTLQYSNLNSPTPQLPNSLLGIVAPPLLLRVSRSLTSKASCSLTPQLLPSTNPQLSKPS